MEVMVEKHFRLLLVFGLIMISELMLLPAVYADRTAEFESCLDGKNGAADCYAAVSECKNTIQSKDDSELQRYYDCSSKCSEAYNNRPSYYCSTYACPEDIYTPIYKECGSACSDELNNWWPGYQTNEKYVSDVEIESIAGDFSAKCEAAKPQETGTDAQAIDDERNELQAEVESLLDEIAEICLGIEGCKPGDRESPGYFNDIINSIIKLHSDSCDKGQCIKVPIDELINLADRIVDWNQREAAWESKFNGLTPEPIETKVRDVNPGILTNLYTNLNTNLKEEISKPSEQDHIAAKQVDLNKNEIFNQLNDAFTEKGKISAEQVASAIKSYEAKLNAGQGEKINVALPKGSSIQNIEAITARSLQDATMTVTVIDEVALNKAVPLLGGKGIIGNPDYPIPQAPLGPPEAGKYSVKEYFSVENSMSADANPLVPFYEKAWFKFSLESSVEAAKNTVLLRYNKDANKWNPLPTQHILSVVPTGLYEFTAESPGTSYFAIVVEKQKSSAMVGWIILGVILIELAALIGAYRLLRRKTEKLGKEHKPKGKGITSLVLGILGIILFWFPPIGFLLAGLSIIFSKIQAMMKPTGLSTAGLVLGIIGVCLNTIILFSIMFYSLSS